ncbi:MAG: B12-binding domain-containing radical SAM protein [Sedimentisphaerales bacterium]|nr:B12-binding domain-containing radical SAM protein [Sedimentisphaerales bacterium]
MKILLINPEVPDTFWSLKNALKFIGKKSSLPPLGLLTVAAMLPEEWDKKLVDMNVNRLRDRDLRWADYVFVTAMLIQQKSVDQVIRRCKKIGTKIVAGGPLFTSLPEDYLHVDHLVLKEAELTLPLFLADLQNGNARKIYNTHEKADLGTTPKPLWSLIHKKKYASMEIQFSRGCPFDCDFCDVTTLFGHKLRTKASAQVVAELENLYVRGWRGNVFFVDDNFIGNKSILKKELLPAITAWMKRRKYPFSFNTQASINLADDEELMDLMVKAGFDCVFVGIETPDEQSLLECNKVQNRNRDLLDCVARIQGSGLQVQAGFILGFDNDNVHVFDNLIQFIQSSGVVTAMVGLLNAPRGTKLYQRLAQEHRLTRPATGDNMDCSINFLPRMGLDQLLAGYRRVVETIYSQPHFCERILTFFKHYQLPRTKRFHLDWSELKAFLRSIWHIGIRGRGRRYYWKLMFWSLRKPRYLHMAVTFSIYGYHFRKIIEAFQNRINALIADQNALPAT